MELRGLLFAEDDIKESYFRFMVCLKSFWPLVFIYYAATVATIMPFPITSNKDCYSTSDDWSFSEVKILPPPWESSELLLRSFINPSDKYSDSHID